MSIDSTNLSGRVTWPVHNVNGSTDRRLWCWPDVRDYGSLWPLRGV